MEFLRVGFVSRKCEETWLKKQQEHLLKKSLYANGGAESWGVSGVCQAHGELR